MTTIGIQFLAALRANAEAWQAAEIDFATFTACLRDTWEAIHGAGPAIEGEVLQVLRDQLPTMSARVGESSSSSRLCRTPTISASARAAVDRSSEPDAARSDHDTTSAAK